MSREELCAHWRNAPWGDPLVCHDTGEYFEDRMRELGGFSPRISKQLGWSSTNDKPVDPFRK